MCSVQSVVPRHPPCCQVLYDVANFLAVSYNHSSPSPAPEDFQLTGATGAALRVKGLKIVKGCSTLAGCARCTALLSCIVNNLMHNRTKLQCSVYCAVQCTV